MHVLRGPLLLSLELQSLLRCPAWLRLLRVARGNLMRVLTAR
jgi:hypothetical protein